VVAGVGVGVGAGVGVGVAGTAPPQVTPPPGWRIERHLATGGTAHVFVVTRGDGLRAILKWGRWRERELLVRYELEAAALRTIGPAWTPALHDHGVIDGWPYL